MIQIQKNNKNTVSIVISAVVMVLMMSMQLVYGATITVNASGGADYTKIQDAINNSGTGDTILVYSGTYYENVDVNKSLVLRGIDNGSGKPVIDANGIGNSITLFGKNSTIEGFKVRNANIDRQVDQTIFAGIYVGSSNNTISNNNVSNNIQGIVMHYPSRGNTLSNNTVSNNSWGGIDLHSSSNNTLSNNTLSNNSYSGIYLYVSSNNTLSNNTASNNWDGISLSYSSNNTLSNNTLSNNNRSGIYLTSSSNNTLSSNTVSNSYKGVYLTSSSNNILIGNNVSNNSVGIWPEKKSINNTIYHNNFVNIQNVIVIFSNYLNSTLESNIWDNGYPSGGNYWDDYKGNDNFSGTAQNQLGSDGIGDTPYNTTSTLEQDRYPFMKMNGWIQEETLTQTIRGDVNRNGKLDTGDASILIRSITGKSIPDKYLPLLPIGDMNCNNKIDTGDVTMILRSIVGMPIKKCW